MKIKLLAAALLLLGLMSCEKVRSSLEVSDKNQPVANTTAENAPVMNFKESHFDFGKITVGDAVTHVFRFTNTGKSPLVIKDIKTQCGCTAADYPKDPVAPGAEADITVNFNTKGKMPGMVIKEVSIYSNTQPEVTKIAIAAQLMAKP